MPYGAFVELEPGVEGLVHVTELSWTKRIAKPSDVLKPDQEIEAVVLGINREEQKISLGVRQLETNPWDKALEKYPPGTQVKGKIRNLTSYGAFIELEEGLDGMIHVSDISWTRKINHPSEVLKKGDEVEAVVLEIDKANQRIARRRQAARRRSVGQHRQVYKVGDLVTGKVTKLASFGAFVGLQHDIDGLVHISQVSEERVDKIKNVLKVGQEVTARVIKIDKGERRIGLSIKAANYSTNSSKSRRCSTRSSPAKISLRCNTPSTRRKSLIRRSSFSPQQNYRDRRTGNSPPVLHFIPGSWSKRRQNKSFELNFAALQW